MLLMCISAHLYYYSIREVVRERTTLVSCTMLLKVSKVKAKFIFDGKLVITGIYRVCNTLECAINKLMFNHM